MRSKTRIKNSDMTVMGVEPSLPGHVNDSKLCVALNWYNYFHDIKRHKQWVVDYMKWKKYSSADIDLFIKSPDNMTTSTMCSIARMLVRGSIFPNTLDEKIQDIIKQEKNVKKIVYFKKDENKLIADLDTVIDIFIMNGYKGDVDVKTIVERAKQTDLQQASVYYQELYDELTCDESKELYDHLTTRQLNRYRELIKLFVDSTRQTRIIKKRSVVRKPRKKKVKTAMQLTQKVQYQQSCNELGIVSINPSKIVECSVLWLYNTKYRKLAKYHSVDGPFIIKGTTIQNFCSKKSQQKTIRKPKEILPSIITDGKVAVDKTFTKIKSKPSKPNGRINSTTLILRAFK